MLDTNHLLATLAYSGVGIAVFLLAWVLILKISPFSIRKEIQDDQNTALAIVIAAVLLGLAHIIAATISG